MLKTFARRLIISKLSILFVVLVVLLSYVAISTYVAMAPTPENIGLESPTDFSVGAASYERYSARVDRVDVVFEQRDYTQYRLTTNDLVREGELNTERGFGDDEDATVYVLNWRQPEGEQMRYVRLTEEPDRIYILDSNQEIIRGSALTLETD